MSIFTGRWGQRIAALLAMVLVLYTATSNAEDYGWTIWSIIAIALVLEYLAYETGVVHGIQMYSEMSPQQRSEMDKILQCNNNE